MLGGSDTIGDGRDAPVVVVAASPWRSGLLATLQALIAHTDQRTALVLACPDSELDALAALVVDGDVVLLGLGADRGLAAALAAVHARNPHADIVVAGEGVLVGEGWLEGLRDAAQLDSIVMTASPLSDPQLDEHEVDAVAAVVRSAAGRLRPTIERAREDCCYIRAAALQLVGVPAAGGADADAIAELSARISAFGLVHVLADEVCVRARIDEALLAGDSSTLRRAVAVAATSRRPLSVTVDARALGSAATGTRTYILDLIAALARERAVRTRVLLPPDTAPGVLAVLEADDAIETIFYDDALGGVPRTDIVHRPQQVFTADDLTLLRLLGERIVITHHDLIGYRCGAYHATIEQWRDYRRVTRLALAQADMVVFGSRHARDDALREGLIAEQRAHMVPIGAERVWPETASEPEPPEGVAADLGLLVCIGADYAHKNRPFALALARELQLRHGWDGRLVLAGPHVEHGSSRERERELLDSDPELAALVVDIGPVGDAQRAWLYAHAEAVVYPSVYEGFGLVPFEAAQAGVPCLYAPVGALGELAGPDAAPLVPWDPAASADAVAPLLSPGDARERHVELLRAAAEKLRWANVVSPLCRVYEQALASPYRASAPRVSEELERESHIVALAASADHDRERASELARANEAAQAANNTAQQALAALRASVGAFADPADGGVLGGARRRGLLRVATRPLLRRILLAPFALIGGPGAGRTDAREGETDPHEGGPREGGGPL